jgi:RimJ/RimL family protein N-acetyltransferase
MRELKSNEFSSVTQLLNEEKVHCTFAYSVVEGKQPGRIYVDNHINPTCCLVTCKGGKYLVAGDTSNIGFNEFLSDYLSDPGNHSNYFDLYSSSPEWISKLDEVLGDNAAKLSRELFQWDYSNLSSISKLNELMPEGFELKKMDAILFEKYVKEMDSSYNKLWGSCNNFISNGFGFCVLKNGEFVSICNTYYVKQGSAEIDITTRDEFRRQGFALITCSAFIVYCAKNNIKPLWDCDGGNESSKNLAKKLGFKSVENYRMHWWHENKKNIEAYLKKFNYSVG